MKFIQLVYENIDNLSKDINFDNKIAGCTALADITDAQLKKVIELGLFGAEGNYAGMDFPCKIALKFDDNGSKYTIVRVFEKKQDKKGNSKETITESAILTDFDEKVIFETTPEEITKFIKDKFFLDKQIIQNVFVYDRENVVAELTADIDTREAFIANQINAITTFDNFVENVQKITDAEKELVSHIDGIKPVTKKEIKSFKNVVEADVLDADNAKAKVADVLALITKAKEYEEVLPEYYETVEKFEKIATQKDTIDALEKSNAQCREAISIGKVFTEYQAKMADADELKKQIADKQAELDKLNARLAKGNASREDYGNKLIFSSQKFEEIDNKVHDLAKGVSANPKTLKIDEEIDKIYAKNDKIVAKLQNNKASLDAKYDALYQECEELRAKRLSLRTTAEYKKNVSDGAVCEAKIDQINDKLNVLEAEIIADEKKLKELAESNEKQVANIKVQQEKYKKLEGMLKGDSGSVKEAENNIILYSHSIYSKHIAASNLDTEIKALEEKIKRLESANVLFATKRENVKASKATIEDHKSKLEAKRAILDDKLAEAVGYNKLRDYADRLEYGAHCPICDGYVSYKKELPHKDISLFQEQIDLLNAEIVKDAKSIDEAYKTIAKYDSSIEMGLQYISSLQDTIVSKQAQIDAILEEFKVDSLEALIAETHETAEKFRFFFITLAEYYELDAQLRMLQERNTETVNEYNQIAEVKLVAERARYEEYDKALLEVVAEYDKLLPTFNGEQATEILAKLHVVEAQYEEIENELEAKEVILADILADRNANEAELFQYSNRLVDIEYKGMQLSFKDVCVLNVARLYDTFVKMLDVRREEVENFKIRLSGINKVVEETRVKAKAVEDELRTLSAELETTEKVATDVYEKYTERFEALGIGTAEELKALSPDIETLETREKTVDQYRADYEVASNNVDVMAQILAEKKAFYDKLAEYNANLEVAQSEMDIAVVKADASMAKSNDMVDRYNDLIESNQKLATVQGKIKAIEELAPAITEGAVLAKDFAKIVVTRANKMIQRWTKDRYYIDFAEDGKIVLINANKTKPVKMEKATKEEKNLLNFGLSTAYYKALLDLVAVDLTPVVKVANAEVERGGVSVVIETSKEHEIIVIPESEDVFFRSASKIL